MAASEIFASPASPSASPSPPAARPPRPPAARLDGLGRDGGGGGIRAAAMVSRSMMSRNSISPLPKRSRQSATRDGDGLSACRRSSCRARPRCAWRSQSPSRESGSTLPISRRYMRTGSSVADIGVVELPAARSPPSSSSPLAAARPRRASPPPCLLPDRRFHELCRSRSASPFVLDLLEDISVCNGAAFSSS